MKKWILGIALIIAAICGVLVAYFDGKPETEPNIPQAVQQVQEGVQIIKGENAAPAVEKK